MRTMALFLLGISVVSASCGINSLDPPTNPTSSFVLKVATSARLVAPSGMTIASYEATGSGPSGATTSATATSGYFSFPGLVAGSWTFQVNGYDSSGAKIATGTVKTVVGTDVYSTVYLAPVTGTGVGTLSIALSWPSSRSIDSVTATMTPMGTAADTVVTATVNASSHTATYSGSLSPGTYVATLTAKKNGVTVAAVLMETLLIYTSKTTSWTASLSDGSSGPGFVSSSKDILSFSFSSPASIGAIDTTKNEINALIPLNTDATSLVPSFTVSEGATLHVGSVKQTSGLTSNDFTGSVAYTVLASDQSSKSYKVNANRFQYVTMPTIPGNSSYFASPNAMVVNASGIYLGTTTSGFIQSTDGGKTWSQPYLTGYGVGGNTTWGVTVAGSGPSSVIYLSTTKGLFISTDNGSTWKSYTSASGLVSDWAYSTTLANGKIYVASANKDTGGVSVSSDNGATWTKYSKANGLGNYTGMDSTSNCVFSVAVSGSTLYAAGADGLYLSTNGGTLWTRYTTAQGLGSNVVWKVLASGSNLYAATKGGFSVSTNGGTSWTNYTTANGLISNRIQDIFVSGATIYAGTDLGLSVSIDQGKNWASFPTPIGSNGVLTIAAYDSTVYIGGISLAKTTDTGTWPSASPAVPSNVTATASTAGKIQIGWSSVPRALGYNVYWSTSPSVSRTTGTRLYVLDPASSYITSYGIGMGSPYLHQGLTSGTKYYYVVTAQNTYGESAPSNAVSATAP